MAKSDAIYDNPRSKKDEKREAKKGDEKTIGGEEHESIGTLSDDEGKFPTGKNEDGTLKYKQVPESERVNEEDFKDWRVIDKSGETWRRKKKKQDDKAVPTS